MAILNKSNHKGGHEDLEVEASKLFTPTPEIESELTNGMDPLPTPKELLDRFENEEECISYETPSCDTSAAPVEEESSEKSTVDEINPLQETRGDKDKSEHVEVQSLSTNQNQDGNFAISIKYRASSKAIFPFAFIALLAVLFAQFPDFLVSRFFNPEQLAQLPEVLQQNMGIILSVLLYAVACAFIYLGFKQILQGTLEIFDDYVKYKTGLLKSTKILYVDLVSVVVHRAPLSAILDIGDLELSSSTQEIRLKNAANPCQIKDQIYKKQELFLLNKKT